MCHSWIVRQISNIGLLILLSILTSRKEFILAQDICEEPSDVTTIVNSTVVFYCTLSHSTEISNNSVVINWRPLHSQNSTHLISATVIYVGERMNMNYSSTHFVNTSLRDQYDLVITNVQLQHAGKYIFQSEGAQTIKSATLSVYENLPSCEIEDGSRLICNVTYAGVRTPELLCDITIFKEDTINTTLYFTNSREPHKNGTDYAINISLPEHDAGILALKCIIKPTVKNSTEDWSFFYEWPKATDSTVSSTEGKGIPNWVTIVAASIVGAIALLANIVFFSIMVIRQKRSRRNTAKSNSSYDCSEIPTHKRNASMIRGRHQSSSLEHVYDSAYEHIPETENTYDTLTTDTSSFDSATYPYSYSIADSKDSDEKADHSGPPLISGYSNYLTMFDTSSNSMNEGETGSINIEIKKQSPELNIDHEYLKLTTTAIYSQDFTSETGTNPFNIVFECHI